jgi:hypothetical protein
MRQVIWDKENKRFRLKIPLYSGKEGGRETLDRTSNCERSSDIKA